MQLHSPRLLSPRQRRQPLPQQHQCKPRSLEGKTPMDSLRSPSRASPRIVCPQTYVSRVFLIRDETRDWSKVLADSLRDDPAFQVMNVTPNATRLRARCAQLRLWWRAHAQESEFVKFMSQMGDGQLAVDGNTVVQQGEARERRSLPARCESNQTCPWLQQTLPQHHKSLPLLHKSLSRHGATPWQAKRLVWRSVPSYLAAVCTLCNSPECCHVLLAGGCVGAVQLDGGGNE